MKTSAFGQKADIVSGAQNVRYWPLADIGSCAANVEAQETDRDRTQEARHFDQLPSAEVSLDVYRKSLKLSRSAALVKLATDHLAGLKEPAEKMWEGAVEHMFPAGDGLKVTIPDESHSLSISSLPS